MSGIPIYTSSPINASKAAGTTPQTTTVGATTSTRNVASASTTSSSTISYTSAQPGAAVPAATVAAQRYTTVQPTSTTQSITESPPAPQPAAFPTPSHRPNLAPPPKAGQTYHPTAPTSLPQPYQMAIPPPVSTHSPAITSTDTFEAPSPARPVPIPIGEYRGAQRSLEHPSGYQQNTFASELSSDQRRALDTANESSTVLGGLGRVEKGSGIDAEGMWNAASTWISSAGHKLSETEEQIWRRINKE